MLLVLFSVFALLDISGGTKTVHASLEKSGDTYYDSSDSEKQSDVEYSRKNRFSCQ